MTDEMTNAAGSMRLRADPPRVTRLSRKLLVGVGAVALMGLAGALIHALQAPEPVDGSGERVSLANRPTADGLTRLPSDYSGPLLGPPLPGDLGGPILDARNRGEPAVPPALSLPGSDPDEERQRAEEEAARLSGLFIEAGPRAGGGSAGAADVAAALGDATGGAMAFLTSSSRGDPVAPERILPPASPYVLQAGAVIPAALITGIRSDLPGQITAQVTENVYDSPTGNHLLIPQGARLIGTYDADIGFGQRRILLVWSRLILPDGRSIGLGREPGADPAGFAGLEDRVDHRWWDLARAAGLSTLLAIGAELASNDDDRLMRAIRDGGQETINEAGQQIIARQLDVAPILTIRTGFPVRVIVTRDLILEPYRR